MINFDTILQNIISNIKEIKENPSYFIREFFTVFVATIIIGSFSYILFALYTVIDFFVSIIFLTIFMAVLVLLQKNKMFKFTKKNILLVTIILWLSLQAIVVVSIEMEYNTIKTNYSQEYISLRNNGFDEINASWEIMENHYDKYNAAYNQKDVILPNRQISSELGIIALSFNPILLYYFFDFDYIPREGFIKLIISQNTGNCGEFALLTQLLIEDVTGFDTRFIIMEGADHAFPEVNINNEWWVFDRTYTTTSKPIKSSDYASFLSTEHNILFSQIRNLKEKSNKTSVLNEHGFHSSNLTITVIKKTIPSENEIVKDAIIEIYTYDNSYDPLIDIGNTDENGQYSTNLRCNKTYLIIAKKETNSRRTICVEIEEIYIPFSDNSSVTVYLRKYN